MEERPGPVHLELPEDIAGDLGPDVPLVHPVGAENYDMASDLSEQVHGWTPLGQSPVVVKATGARAQQPALG